MISPDEWRYSAAASRSTNQFDSDTNCKISPGFVSGEHGDITYLSRSQASAISE